MTNVTRQLLDCVLCRNLNFTLMFSGHLLKHLFKGGQSLTKRFFKRIFNLTLVTKGLPSFLCCVSSLLCGRVVTEYHLCHDSQVRSGAVPPVPCYLLLQVLGTNSLKLTFPCKELDLLQEPWCLFSCVEPPISNFASLDHSLHAC